MYKQDHAKDKFELVQSACNAPLNIKASNTLKQTRRTAKAGY